jgi:hypothetical protein
MFQSSAASSMRLSEAKMLPRKERVSARLGLISSDRVTSASASVK